MVHVNPKPWPCWPWRRCRRRRTVRTFPLPCSGSAAASACSRCARWRRGSGRRAGILRSAWIQTKSVGAEAAPAKADPKPAMRSQAGLRFCGRGSARVGTARLLWEELQPRRFRFRTLRTATDKAHRPRARTQRFRGRSRTCTNKHTCADALHRNTRMHAVRAELAPNQRRLRADFARIGSIAASPCESINGSLIFRNALPNARSCDTPRTVRVTRPCARILHARRSSF